jgi:WD40 repeat protein
MLLLHLFRINYNTVKDIMKQLFTLCVINFGIFAAQQAPVQKNTEDNPLTVVTPVKPIHDLINSYIDIHDEVHNTLRLETAAPKIVLASLAISRDNKLAVIMGGHGENGAKNVHIFDLATGQLQADLPHPQALIKITFSPNGKYLAAYEHVFSQAPFFQYIYLWNIHTKQLITRFLSNNRESKIQFSPDSQYIAYCPQANESRIASRAPKHVELLHLESNKKIILNNIKGAFNFTFSPDSQNLAIALSSPSSDIIIYNLQHHKVQKRFTLDYRAHTITFSPDGKYLAAQEEEFPEGNEYPKTGLLIWDVEKGTLAYRITKDNRPAKCITFSADSNTLFTDSIKFNLVDGTSQEHFKDKLKSNIICSVDKKFLLESDFLFCDPEKTPSAYTIYNLVNGSTFEQSRNGLSKALAAAYSPDGTYLVVAYNDKQVIILKNGADGLKSQTH